MLPKDSEDRVKLDVEKVQAWLKKGARPTERVARFLGAAGLWRKRRRKLRLKKLQKHQSKRLLQKSRLLKSRPLTNLLRKPRLRVRLFYCDICNETRSNS